MRAASLLFVLLAAGGPLGAQTLPGAAPSPTRTAPGDSALEAQARAIAAQLRCVVCQGLSVEDSPSELAQEMKNVVREQLRQGKSEAEIKAYFVGRYGEYVLLEPEPRGFNLVVYLLPVLALLAGAFILFRAVRGWTRPAHDDEAAAAEPPPAETTRERV